MERNVEFGDYTIRHLKKRFNMLTMGWYFNSIRPDCDGLLPFTRPNFVSLPLHICTSLKKTLFTPSPFSDDAKKQFSCRRRSATPLKTVSQPCGISRFIQKSLFTKAELPAASNIKICLTNKFDSYCTATARN
jgi:hypothetical protein